MAQQIEGIGLEQEAFVAPPKVEVAQAPVEETVPEVVVPQGESAMERFVDGLVKEYQAFEGHEKDKVFFRGGTNPKVVKWLCQWAYLDDEYRLSFRPVPFADYVSMLGETHPDLHVLLSETDLSSLFPDQLDLTSAVRADNLYKVMPAICNWYEDGIITTVNRLDQMGRASVYIPDSEFLSLFFSEPESFLGYLKETNQSIGTPAFFAIRCQPKSTESYDQRAKLPTRQDLFSVEKMKLYAGKGNRQIATLVQEYNHLMCALSTGRTAQQGKLDLGGLLQERNGGAVNNV